MLYLFKWLPVWIPSATTLRLLTGEMNKIGNLITKFCQENLCLVICTDVISTWIAHLHVAADQVHTCPDNSGLPIRKTPTRPRLQKWFKEHGKKLKALIWLQNPNFPYSVKYAHLKPDPRPLVRPVGHQIRTRTVVKLTGVGFMLI